MTEGEDDYPLALTEYQAGVNDTDQLAADDKLLPVVGLFGEIGSLLAVMKKRERDKAPSVIYQDALTEELGDSLWYFTAIANRAGLQLPVLAQRVFRGHDDWDEVDEFFGTWGDMTMHESSPNLPELEPSMVALAATVGELVGSFQGGKLDSNRDRLAGELVSVLGAIINLVNAAQIDIERAAVQNLRKARGRWREDGEYPPLSDEALPPNERLPREFEMFIGEYSVGKKTYVLQKCRGIIIGDRLTDNREEQDDYRFHDVFHIAYAVHLGWSPVLRALFRVKRKSVPSLDENQDGARAILIEEGIATLVFGRARDRDLFADVTRVDSDLLKLVQEFVQGYEVERAEAWQWERAILDGFAVFRQLQKERRGYVVANLKNHTLSFRPGRDPLETQPDEVASEAPF